MTASPDFSSAPRRAGVSATVTHLAVRYPDAASAAPDGVSFSVGPGEVVLILGPSGSGKSTLALSLNGLIPHAIPADISGSVLIDGRDTTQATVAELSPSVAMVFQDPDAQIVTSTVFDEVAFGPENLALPVPEVLSRAEASLRRVGLWERRDDNPDRLSGGGRQRLAIATALAMGSGLLVLDEPTANLDPQGIDDVAAALTDVVAAGERSVVLVEHNLDVMVELVTRVLVLDANGRLVADGTTDAVLRGRAAELSALGVWLPVSALAALRLRAAGYALDPLPLTAAELRAALETAAQPAAGGADTVRTDASTAVPRTSSPTPAPVTAPAPAEPIIRVRDLTVRRGRTPVLHGIDLDVRAGEFLAVVGPNGAGKTTLVQAIAGVVPPPRGRVVVDGIDPGRADVAALTARIGFVFQNPEHQFVTNSVFDELAQGLRLRGANEAEIQTRVADMLERFGLTGREASHPFLLSGGQKRRLSVGTALIAGAPVLALDEPTFGQDRARADELLGILAELNAQGTTVIVVTHDMQLVTEYATHTAVIVEGRLLAHAPTADIFADDQLLRAAGLRRPPLASALAELSMHPEISGIVRLADLPGTPSADSGRLGGTEAQRAPESTEGAAR
ncbi:ABC transporter related protein [Microbacterium sp. C448]|uniref:ABC transporter ATP-binding protein n=1 Tax=Microbacterium sp. C448 TaxID=1177594 RepID=UPI0003DE1116|nr:ABC transporter related protein [Microbacterium sp. C448]